MDSAALPSLVVCGLLLTAVLASPGAASADVIVTAATFADDGSTDSLRELIIAANEDGDSSTITLLAGTYPLVIVGPNEDAAAICRCSGSGPPSWMGSG